MNKYKCSQEILSFVNFIYKNKAIFIIVYTLYIQEDKKMKIIRPIDSKSKEIYFKINPILEDEETLNSRFTFWVNMNNLAMQNMMVQQMKMG